jgi:hypothetical protein
MDNCEALFQRSAGREEKTDNLAKVEKCSDGKAKGIGWAQLAGSRTRTEGKPIGKIPWPITTSFCVRQTNYMFRGQQKQ